MDYFVEKSDPSRDLGGLCECNEFDEWSAHPLIDYHVHEHFELLYILEGSFELCAENHTHLLEKGSATLIHPMEPHATCSSGAGKNSYMVLKFTPATLYSVSQPAFELKYISPYLRFSDRRVHMLTADARLKNLLNAILQERKSEEYGYEMALRAYVCQVLLLFIRDWNSARVAQSIDDRIFPRLERALTYIDDHISEDLCVQEVADILGMGLSAFSRFFGDAAGMSFPAYVRSRRLRQAALMLSNSRTSVSEIAAKTGFNSASYLTLCFRKQYGITPHQFRKHHDSPEE